MVEIFRVLREPCVGHARLRLPMLVEQVQRLPLAFRASFSSILTRLAVSPFQVFALERKRRTISRPES